MAWSWQSWRLRLAAIWLAFALGCMAWACLQLVTGQKIETNLLALLPPTERNPRAELAVNKLSETLGNRALFLIGHSDAEAAHQLSRRFADSLRNSGAFKQIHDAAPKADAAVLLDFYRPFRSTLLTQTDRDALAKAGFDPASRLARRLHQPFASGLATPLADDPLGLWQQWLSTLPLTQSRLTIANEQLVARDGETTWVLVLADLGGSAYDDKIQNAVIEALNKAQREIAGQGAQLLHTGGVFYGAAARSSAEREVDFIGAGSLIGILLMMAWLFRSLKPLGLAMLTVAIGLGCALAATLAVFGQLHLLTLVFGASLIGEAVDYAIQYFTAQLDAGSEWEPVSGLQRILRGLAVALATSLIGYGALALSPFPAIGQIALFAFAGLAAAWISVVLLLPLLTRQPMTRDVTSATRLPRALLDLWCRKMTPWRAAMVVAALLVLAAPGLFKLQGNDDIRLLINRPAALQSEEAKIRQLAGFNGSTRFYLVEGKDWEEVLQREEQLASRLVAAGGRAPLAVSSFVPSRQRQQENQALQQRLLAPERHLERTLADAGFRDDLAQHWLAELRAQAAPLTVA
ncbi:MAG TPA: MMPL family transporter, partial [Rhodocyclaceae bacterium]|nr:MMPL family transporter [Rhodocyclaceae bacterium]